MLLLLFAGATAAPVTSGERAYATPYFSNAEDASVTLTLVNEAQDAVTTTTDAYPTEE